MLHTNGFIDLLCLNLNTFSLKAPENAWIFNDKLSQTIRQAAKDWLSEQTDELKRSTYFANVSLTDILSPPVTQKCLSFLGYRPNLYLTLGERRPLSSCLRVNKQWNTFAMNVQFHNKSANFIVPPHINILPNTLAPLFLRIRPKHLFVSVSAKQQGNAVLQELIRASHQDKTIVLDSMYFNNCCFSQIDGNLPLFQNLQSITLLTASTANAHPLMEYLDSIRRSSTNRLMYLNVGTKIEGFSSPQTLPALLPANLRSYFFPLQRMSDVRGNYDSWVTSVFDRCRQLEELNSSFIRDDVTYIPFGLEALRKVAGMTSLRKAMIVVRPDVEMECIFHLFRELVANNVGLERFEMGLLGQSEVDYQKWEGIVEDVRGKKQMVDVRRWPRKGVYVLVTNLAPPPWVGVMRFKGRCRNDGFRFKGGGWFRGYGLPFM